jgi:hypothetical protein
MQNFTQIFTTYKLKYTILFSLAFVLICFVNTSFAQGRNIDSSANKRIADSFVKKRIVDSFAKRTVGIFIGTRGYGFRFYHTISKHFAFDLGYSQVSLASGTSFFISNQDTYINLNVKAKSTSLRFYYTPSTKNKISLVGGVNYFFNTKADAKISLKNKIPFGDLMLNPYVIGDIKSSILWDGLSPYLGMQWKKKMGKKFYLSIEAGVNYMSRPKVEYFEGSGLLQDNFLNQEQFNNNLRTYRWLPVLEFGISYSIFNHKKIHKS